MIPVNFCIYGVACKPRFLLTACSAVFSCSCFNVLFPVFSGTVANLLRLQSLAEQLTCRGFSFYQGAGQDDAGLWPAEASVVIPGIDRQATTALATHYAQHAFLYIEIH